jgi:hypothetical protein
MALGSLPINITPVTPTACAASGFAAVGNKGTKVGLGATCGKTGGATLLIEGWVVPGLLGFLIVNGLFGFLLVGFLIVLGSAGGGMNLLGVLGVFVPLSCNGGVDVTI